MAEDYEFGFMRSLVREKFSSVLSVGSSSRSSSADPPAAENHEFGFKQLRRYTLILGCHEHLLHRGLARQGGWPQ